MSHAPSAEAQTSAEGTQTRLGGHFGFVLPLSPMREARLRTSQITFLLAFHLGLPLREKDAWPTTWNWFLECKALRGRPTLPYIRGWYGTWGTNSASVYE